MPLEREHPRDKLGGGRAGMAACQIEHQIVPGHGGARTDQFLAPAGDDQDALGVDRHLRIGGGEGAGVAEMHRRIDAIEKSRFGEQENARAGRA